MKKLLTATLMGGAIICDSVLGSPERPVPWEYSTCSV